MRHELIDLDELPVGTMRALEVDNLSLVVCRTHDGVHAFRNRCPHQGAVLSNGSMLEKVVEAPDDPDTRYALSDAEFVIRCPWHGYEFDADTGRCYGDPDRIGIHAFAVTVEGGKVVLDRTQTTARGNQAT